MCIGTKSKKGDAAAKSLNAKKVFISFNNMGCLDVTSTIVLVTLETTLQRWPGLIYSALHSYQFVVF